MERENLTKGHRIDLGLMTAANVLLAMAQLEIGAHRDDPMVSYVLAGMWLCCAVMHGLRAWKG